MINPDEVKAAARSIVRDDNGPALPSTSHFALRPVFAHAAEAWELVYREDPIEDPVVFRGPSLIQGEPVDPSCLNGVGDTAIQIGSNRIYRASKVTVAGWRSLLTSGGGVFMGTALATPHDLEHRKARSQSGFEGCMLLNDTDPSNYQMLCLKASGYQLPGTGVFAGAIEPGNFGSFLIRVLPLLLLLAEQNFPFDYLVVPEKTMWIGEALNLLGFSGFQLYSARDLVGVECLDLYVPTEIDREGFIDARSLERLRRFAALCSLRSSRRLKSRAKSLYVSRRMAAVRSPNYRTLVNEDVVESTMTKRGFSVLHPQAYSFAEQVAAFSVATHVVGPSGSGLLNAMFSPADAQVLDLESFHYTVRQHAKVYASSGKRYGFVFGKPLESDMRQNWVRNWSIGPADITAALDVMASQQGLS